MKLTLLALSLLTSPLYAHVSHQAAPQHSVEHMLIGAAIIIVGVVGRRVYKKIKQR